MRKDIYISEVMNSKLLTLHPKDSISRCKEIFQQYKVHHILVAVSGKLVGILSMGDVIMWDSIQANNSDQLLSNRNNPSIACVEEIMTKKPVCVRKDDKLSRAIDIMVKYRINALPVVDDESLLGIVTSYDFLKLLQNEIK